jgi:Rrf2 family protein
MRITRQADYAVRTMVYLSGLPMGRRVTTSTLSKAEDIPRPFLTKVISGLVTAGLVVTSRGMGGGVTLARPSEEITLLHVIEAIDGPIRLSQSLLPSRSNESESHSAIQEVLARIQARLVQDLDAVTMGELSQRQAGDKP